MELVVRWDEMIVCAVPPPLADVSAIVHKHRVSANICIFKIGVAANPTDRFLQNEYGYCMTGYDYMVVLWKGMPRECAHMERMLIRALQGVIGIQNYGPGGEGIDIDNTSYDTHVYVVIASCGDGTAISRRVRRRAGMVEQLRQWNSRSAM